MTLDVRVVAGTVRGTYLALSNLLLSISFLVLWTELPFLSLAYCQIVIFSFVQKLVISP